MQSHHSRLVNSARLIKHSFSLAALALGVSVNLAALGILAPQRAAAQTQVSITYLRDTTGPGGVVSTAQSSFVSSGVATVSVLASFTGNGYNFGGSGSFLQPPPGEAAISDGDSFIVTPIIDPDLYLNYQLHNESGFDLSSLTFTLAPTSDLYFFSTTDFPTASSALLGTPTFGGFIGRNTFNGNVRNAYKSVTFSSSRAGETLTSNGQGIFSLAIHIPDASIGQSFAAVISPNGLAPLAFPATAPEPGTLSLLLPLGLVLGAATRAKWRNRTS